MNATQKKQLALEERRRELGVLLEVEERGADFSDKLKSAKEAIVSAQEEVQDAALAEPEDKVEVETRTETPEGAEIRELRKTASFDNYLVASSNRRGVNGAEAEFNAALGIGELSFPLEMLASPEARAKIDVDGQTNVSSWLDMLFADAAAMRLGVSFRSVAPGIAGYPVTTSGPVGQQRMRTEAASAVAFGVNVKELKPTRMATHLIYSIEDVARMPGLADAIRRQMADAMIDAVDKAVFLGADAGGTDADILGLTTATGLSEVTLTQTKKVKADDTLSIFAELIDGKYAAGPGDIRIVAAQGANSLWMKTIHAAAVDNQTIAQFLQASGITWMVRGDIESNTANGDFGAFMGLARGIEGAAVLPIWENGTLITDPYSGADKGEVALTMNTLWNFELVRTFNFKRLKFVT